MPPGPEHASHPDQLMASALGVCWHSPTADRLPCQPELTDRIAEVVDAFNALPADVRVAVEVESALRDWRP